MGIVERIRDVSPYPRKSEMYVVLADLAAVTMAAATPEINNVKFLSLTILENPPVDKLKSRDDMGGRLSKRGRREVGKERVRTVEPTIIPPALPKPQSSAELSRRAIGTAARLTPAGADREPTRPAGPAVDPSRA
jgi:hypothetical protein